MQVHGEVIDLRLASSGGCCFSAMRDYSILLLRCSTRSRKCNDAMPTLFYIVSLCHWRLFAWQKQCPGYSVQGMISFFSVIFACSRSLTIMQWHKRMSPVIIKRRGKQVSAYEAIYNETNLINIYQNQYIIHNQLNIYHGRIYIDVWNI